jgi:DMSO/TMAO reductase YedYZ heme-binding membrane subunit
MMAEWRHLSTITRIFYICGLIGFIGLAIMILTGITSIGDILAKKWELLKQCLFCM